MELRRSSPVVFKLILKGILKEKFRLISSPMKSRVILKRLQKHIKWVEALLVLYIRDTEYLVCCPFYVLQALLEEENE